MAVEKLRSDEQTEVVRLRDPLRMLARFHGDIRRVLARLDQLAADPQRPGAADEATALAAFLTGPLALHDLDEETVLLPAIAAVAARQRGHVIQVQQAQHDHAHMEERIGALLPQLWQVAKQRRFDPARLRDDIAALHTLLDEHLRMEETVLFPLARRLLEPVVLAGLAEELLRRAQSRRG